MPPLRPRFLGAFDLNGKLICRQTRVADLSSMSSALRPSNKKKVLDGLEWGEGRGWKVSSEEVTLYHQTQTLQLHPQSPPFTPVTLHVLLQCLFPSLSLSLLPHGSPSPSLFPQRSALGSLFHFPPCYPSAQTPTAHDFMSMQTLTEYISSSYFFNEHQLCLSTASGYFCMKILFQLPI